MAGAGVVTAPEQEYANDQAAVEALLENIKAQYTQAKEMSQANLATSAIFLGQSIPSVFEGIGRLNATRKLVAEGFRRFEGTSLPDVVVAAVRGDTPEAIGDNLRTALAERSRVLAEHGDTMRGLTVGELEARRTDLEAAADRAERGVLPENEIAELESENPGVSFADLGTPRGAGQRLALEHVRFMRLQQTATPGMGEDAADETARLHLRNQARELVRRSGRFTPAELEGETVGERLGRTGRAFAADPTLDGAIEVGEATTDAIAAGAREAVSLLPPSVATTVRRAGGIASEVGARLRGLRERIGRIRSGFRQARSEAGYRRLGDPGSEALEMDELNDDVPGGEAGIGESEVYNPAFAAASEEEVENLVNELMESRPLLQRVPATPARPTIPVEDIQGDVATWTGNAGPHTAETPRPDVTPEERAIGRRLGLARTELSQADEEAIRATHARILARQGGTLQEMRVATGSDISDQWGALSRLGRTGEEFGSPGLRARVSADDRAMIARLREAITERGESPARHSEVIRGLFARNVPRSAGERAVMVEPGAGPGQPGAPAESWPARAGAASPLAGPAGSEPAELAPAAASVEIVPRSAGGTAVRPVGELIDELERAPLSEANAATFAAARRGLATVAATADREERIFSATTHAQAQRGSINRLRPANDKLQRPGSSDFRVNEFRSTRAGYEAREGAPHEATIRDLYEAHRAGASSAGPGGSTESRIAVTAERSGASEASASAGEARALSGSGEAARVGEAAGREVGEAIGHEIPLIDIATTGVDVGLAAKSATALGAFESLAQSAIPIYGIVAAIQGAIQGPPHVSITHPVVMPR